MEGVLERGLVCDLLLKGDVGRGDAQGAPRAPPPVFEYTHPSAKDAYALNIPANLENSVVATELERVNFNSNPKECSNYYTVALISQASK